MIIGHVYRVRTDCIRKGAPHCAKKGSLVVIMGIWPPEVSKQQPFYGQGIGFSSGDPMIMSFRPCDLSRVEFHDEVNS